MSGPPPLPPKPSQKALASHLKEEEDDDNDNDDDGRESTYFDANDAFFDESGRRVSMRYSLAVISSRRSNSILYAGKRNSHRNSQRSSSIIQHGTTTEERQESSIIHEEPEDTHGDNLLISEAINNGKAVVDSVAPSPTASLEAENDLPAPNEAVMRKKKSVDPLSFQIHRRTTLRTASSEQKGREPANLEVRRGSGSSEGDRASSIGEESIIETTAPASNLSPTTRAGEPEADGTAVMSRTSSQGIDGSAESTRRVGNIFSKMKLRRNKKDTVDTTELELTQEDTPSIAHSVTSSSAFSTKSASTSAPNNPYGDRYIKTRIKNKHSRVFPRLFLGQTIPAPSSVSQSQSPTTSNFPSKSTKPPSPEPETTRGTGTAIWIMKFSKDGKYLSVGGQDGVVRVYGLRTEHDVAEANAVEGTFGVSVFKDAPVREYSGHTADVLDLSWSKNNFLLSSSMDKTVRLWHVSRKECLCSFQHLDFVTSIAFHPRDDRFFLSGSLDCKLRLWNIPEKKVSFWNETQDSQLITAVGFTTDGKIAVAGSYEGDCLFYETEGLKYNTQINLTDAERGGGAGKKKGRKITGIEAMPGVIAGEEKLLITSNDSRVRLLNVRDKSVEEKFRGAENASSQIRATFSDNGEYVICGSEDHFVYIWEMPMHHHQYNSHGILSISRGPSAGGGAFAALGEQVLNAATLSASAAGPVGAKVGGWLKKGSEKVKDQLRGGWESFEAHSNTVTCAVFAPTKTKQHLANLGTDPIFNNTPVSIPIPRGGTETASTYSLSNYTFPMGDIIVSADYTGRIKVWRHDCGLYPDTSNQSIPPPTRSSTSIDRPTKHGLGGLFSRKRAPGTGRESMDQSGACPGCGGTEFKSIGDDNGRRTSMEGAEMKICVKCNRVISGI